MTSYEIAKMKEAIRALQAVEGFRTPRGRDFDFCEDFGRICGKCACARIGLEVALEYAEKKTSATEEAI